MEPCAAGLLALFHEAGDGALALAQLGHGEGAELVQAHHLRHGGEHHSGFEAIAVGGYRFNHFLSQIFDEDQGADEHIGFSHIGAEIGVIARVAQFLNQVAAQVNGQRTVLIVE